MFHSRLLAAGLFLFAASASLSATTVLSENFSDITTLGGSGWTQVNNSGVGGTVGWFQGVPAVFSAQSGTPESYIAANFNDAGFGGNISNWLITPVLSFQFDLQVSFFTRTETDPVAADRLEFRLSQNGASTDVGATDSSVGDFTTLLLTVNPTLSLSGYPQTWTQVTANIIGSGLPTTGRLAFRYNVPDTSINADYIGIDTVLVTTPSAASTPEPGTLGSIALGLCLAAAYRRRRQVMADRS
jgi:hypothetical protein